MVNWQKFLVEKMGCTALVFRPFDPIENLYCSDGLTEEEYIHILKEHVLSTVYKGVRYFFKTPENLQAFCEMVENAK